MGLTNIHYGEQLLNYAGRSSTATMAALLCDHKQMVEIIGRHFVQREVDAFQPWIAHDRINVWTERKEESSALNTTNPPARVLTPALYLSPALARSFKNEETEPRGLIFVLLVQGDNAAAVMKVRLLHSREAAAAAVMEEALSRHTIAFSGAVRSDDMNRIRQGVNLHVVTDLTQLVAESEVESQAKEEMDHVRIFC